MQGCRRVCAGAPNHFNLPSFKAAGLTLSRVTAGDTACCAAHIQRFERDAQE